MKALLLMCSVVILGSGQLSHAFSSGPVQAPVTSVPGTTASSSGELIWVSRPDGSKQCETGGQSVETAESELKKAGIRVVASRKGTDGKMRAQMCGIPSGSVNAYQIPASDLPKAITLGFQKTP